MRRRRSSYSANPEGSPSLIFAHRGLSESAPEDSLSAWQKAAAAGYACEGDFRLSSDNGIICLHDATLDRTTNGTGAPNLQTLAALVALDNGSKFNSVGYAAERIPTLAQMLAVCKAAGVWAIPEISDQTLAAGRLICNAVRAAGMQNRSIVQCFDPAPYNILKVLVGEYPEIQFMALVNTAWGAPVPAAVAAAGIRWVGPDINSAFFNQAWVQSMQAVGVKVCPYTIDSDTLRTAALAAGVDRMFSGRPRLATSGLYAAAPLSETWTGISQYMWGEDWLIIGTTNVSPTLPRPGNGNVGIDDTTAAVMGAINIAKPLPAAGVTYTIDTTITLKATNADATRWWGFQVCCQQDSMVTIFNPVNAGRNAYGALIRQNGTMEIAKYASGVISSTLATQASTALVLNTPVPLRLTVSPTNITLRRTDTSVQVTAADATWRAGKLGLMWTSLACRIGPLVGA